MGTRRPRPVLTTQEHDLITFLRPQKSKADGENQFSLYDFVRCNVSVYKIEAHSFSINCIMRVATSARVVWSVGARVPALLPEMRPAFTAQSMPSSAQEEMLA